MNTEVPGAAATPAERKEQAAHLAEAEAYGEPRKVWVEDGHVFVEGYDGRIISLTPEVAIKMGRMLSQAGSDSLVNRVMDGATERTEEG